MNQTTNSFDKEQIVLSFEVRYENGLSHFLHQGITDSLERAISIATESIFNCVPKDVNPDDLVKPVIARRLDVCAMCGSANELQLIPLGIPLRLGSGVSLCENCIAAVKNI